MTISAVQTAFARLRRSLPRRPRIYVGGGSGAPLALLAALRADPELAAGVTFLGAWIPGLDQVDWASLHPEARAETSFASPAWRASLDIGHTRLLALTYSQTWTWLSDTRLDAAIIVTSPPDDSGWQSFGIAPDFGPALIGRPDVRILALSTPCMPAPIHAPGIPAHRLSDSVATEAPLAHATPGDPASGFSALGQQVAGLIGDGDTLQIGIGSVPKAILAQLHGHRDLRFHSGLVTDDILALAEAGAVADHPRAIVTGIAWGSPALYAQAAGDARFSFNPVTVTHHPAILSALPRFKAINSALSIDLHGQANAEFVNGRQVSGIGGLSDFLRGARAAPGGRGILALPATARQGTISRIGLQLPPAEVTLSRYDTDIVVTEYGVADLRGRTADARADALIAIAAPAFRAGLADGWTRLRTDGRP